MDPFVGEIRIMPYGGNNAYNYIPQGWAPCQGQLLPINQNQALFALLSTQYGGDGRTTFAVPDLRGRAIVGQGQSPGLSNYPQGSTAGTESVTLNANQVPAHIHPLQGGTSSVAVASSPGNQNGAANGYFAANPSQEQYGQAASGNTKQMLSGITAAAGGNQAHEDRMPFLAFNYFIALTGVFPQRQ